MTASSEPQNASDRSKPKRTLAQRLPFPSHIPLYASLTYLFGICLFSISFLVFLNSSLSFVVTDLLGIHDGLGDIVGNLGFVDELVAVVSVIAWGTLSDKIGTRLVTVIGYSIVGLALFLIVQTKNVYPQLLLARMLFSLGASATATMVSAVLPELSTLPPPAPTDQESSTDSAMPDPSSTERPPSSNQNAAASSSSNSARSFATRSSVSSRRRLRRAQSVSTAPRSITGKLSGLVGFTAGSGALVALAIFLPLPTKFAQRPDITKEQAVKYSFYTVGTIAWLVGIICFVGLRGKGVGGETSPYWNIPRLFKNGKDKSRAMNHSGDVADQQRSSLLPIPDEEEDGTATYGTLSKANMKSILPDTNSWKNIASLYFRALWYAFKAGHEDWRLGLAYLGGFVARASSVGISLFIPLYVNQYMLSTGICAPPAPGSDLKHTCREAYILSAELTGTSQSVALLTAPIIGYLTDRYQPQVPLLTTSLLGFFSFIGFSMLPSLSAGADRSWAFFLVSGMGIAQIGAIVASLALIGKAVAQRPEAPSLHNIDRRTASHLIISEAVSVNPMSMDPKEYTQKDRMALKGSIAGVYSLCGAIGILILTKLGGWGADKYGRGIPFVLLALFFGFEVCFGLWLVVKNGVTTTTP